MAVNIKPSKTSSGISLFELDENNDDMPVTTVPAKFEIDNNLDVMPHETLADIQDEEFELDENGDITLQD